MSVKKEVEQDGTKKSVKVDVTSQRTTSSLPLMNNPSGKLAHNKKRTLRSIQQTKKLNQVKEEKKDVFETEEKLQRHDYVDYVKNLKSEQREMLQSSEKQVLERSGIKILLAYTAE